MKRNHLYNTIVLTKVLLLCNFLVCSQEIPLQLQQQLENMVNATEEETEDDSYWQQLERYTRHPLRINDAGEEELRSLGILNEWQIVNLLGYRKALGKLISVYELQAVPGWEPALIRRLLPFIIVDDAVPLKEEFAERFRKGVHSILLRVSRIMQKQKGFTGNAGGAIYTGSPQKIFARYRYVYKNLLQFGWTGDKDAGEQFFGGRQRAGFDFNSFHLFVRRSGWVRALALGDFTVNMGQGLIQWQSLAFGKSGEVMAIKRQSPVLRPYTSAGEYNFHRGLGATMQKGAVEWTVFVSWRRLSASINEDSSGQFVSSVITSGYHRTQTEYAGKNILKQFVTGTSIRYKKTGLLLGLNAIRHSFSIPLKKRDEPYNLYGVKGRDWMNISMDYSYTIKNIHFFGEAAADRRGAGALIQGCLISVDPRVDVSIVYRNIAAEYQAINANAFTENTLPSNERGLYTGVSIRPVPGWKLDAFADFYQFPWLKYLIDAPAYGKDFLCQLVHTPSKQVELQVRATHSLRLREAPRSGATDYLIPVSKTTAQLLISHALNKSITIRNRLQLLWLRNMLTESGYSLCADVLYKPPVRPFSFSARVQFFETAGYDSRLYAFENDVLYNHSIPAVFGKGMRYYAIAQINIKKDLILGFRLAQTVYREQDGVGSGLDLISGNRKTEIKIQGLYTFK